MLGGASRTLLGRVEEPGEFPQKTPALGSETLTFLSFIPGGDIGKSQSGFIWKFLFPVCMDHALACSPGELALLMGDA